jgi:hypothetical protein
MIANSPKHEYGQWNGKDKRKEEEPTKVTQLAGKRGGIDDTEQVIIEQQENDRSNNQRVSHQAENLVKRRIIHSIVH